MNIKSYKKEKIHFLLYCLGGVFVGICSVVILGQSNSFFAEFPTVFNFFLGFISVVVPAFAVMLPESESL